MTWTSDMAARRVALIRRSLQAACSGEERAELDALTETMLAARFAPATTPRVMKVAIDAAWLPARDVPGTRLPACRECGAFDPCSHDRGEDA